MIIDKKIVVSVTSYPKRIRTVSKMLESLFRQTMKPDKIVLWLSIEEFSEKEKDLPENLLNIIGTYGFTICWIRENIRSHKKYFYALQEYVDDIVITVDDDIYYSPTMIEELVNSYDKFPNAVSARNVHKILKHEGKVAAYEIWENNYKECEDRECQDFCAIGWGGVLYPPRIASARWFCKLDIENYSPNQDDLWLKFNEVLDNIPTVYVRNSCEDVIITDTQECALYKTNVFENLNNMCIDYLYKWSKLQDNELIREWLSCLEECGQYYNNQREKFATNLKSILQINKGKKIYICGAGKFAQSLIKLFDYCEEYSAITGLVVSGYYKNPAKVQGVSVLKLENVDFNKDTLVICGVSEKHRTVLKPYFDSKQCAWLDLGIEMVFRCIRNIDLLK